MSDLPVYEISIPEAKVLADLVSLHNDLLRVKSTLNQLLATKNETIEDACFSASLITYRRCFKSGIRNGLSRNDIIALKRNAIELHDYLVNQANKLIAHSVNPFEQTTVGVVVDGQRVVGIATLSGRLMIHKEDGTKQWIRLVDIIDNDILRPRLKVALDTAERSGKTLPIAEIVRKPILRYTAPSPDGARKQRK